MIPQIVANFVKPATTKTIPIIVLGFITLLFIIKHFWVQRYKLQTALPNNWDILHWFVINGHKSVIKWLKSDEWKQIFHFSLFTFHFFFVPLPTV